MDHMQLVLQRPAELEKQLESFMTEQQRKGSAEYHHWLTVQEFGDLYGVAPADIQTVTGWLGNHGFRVDSVLPSGMAIEFSGNAGQVRQAFHTEIHNLDVKGEAHFANMTDPRIPAALTGVVKGVRALHNFMPHPHNKKRTAFDTGYGFHDVAPADLATIYNLNPAFSNGITGQGQTIAVVELSLLANPGDVTTFRNTFGLSGYSGTFSQVVETGPVTCLNPGVNQSYGGAETEAALDAEWAGASAPGTNIVLAACQSSGTVNGMEIAFQNLIDTPNPPQIISVSFGECEAFEGAAGNASLVNMYQEAAALGISVFVASGDSGAAGATLTRPTPTTELRSAGMLRLRITSPSAARISATPMPAGNRMACR